MGTNYYARFNLCEHCERYDELHIGKSSAGWCFSLHVYPQPDEDRPKLDDWPDWEAFLEDRQAEIRDEYHNSLTVNDLRLVVMARAWPNDRPRPPQYLEANHAVNGPAGLMRHRIEAGRCIGHGAGTWDLIVGEFS